MNPERARRLLCRLQDAIRAAVLAARVRGTARLARIAAVTAADTIYAIDRVSEAAVQDWLEENWPRTAPLELVMEGLAEDAAHTFPRGTPVAATRWKLLLDPIDGTRGLMFDKRSAWSLAGLAPQRGARTTLADITVAAMTELPTAKAGCADQLSAVRGRGVRAERIDLRDGRRRRLALRPSTARDVAHGFASFAKFFPEGKAWLAAREEALWRELGVDGAANGQPVFDDQYLSTGGQLHELIAGHDRFVADLRPLAFARLGLARGAALACHPYDLCAELIAREAGCVVTAPDGRPLRAPLDTTTPVAWTGYANRALARRLAPALRRVLARK
ncbi:inositol monophosphatase [Oleiharenicola sp. Vm1]|uniref:inositol monophosphatase n=1 Tax=Oleiharenicola sp. Vm1 TaxID=3398393 RepID=UPI0039F5343B